jgi:hypothetical protein
MTAINTIPLILLINIVYAIESIYLEQCYYECQADIQLFQALLYINESGRHHNNV